MDNNTLARYETQDGIELVINQQTGESFATRNGLSRMCNVAPSTITKWKASSQIHTFEAEIQTVGGLQGGSLFSEDAILQALERYNPSMLHKFAKLGLRMSLHQIAGFKLPSTEKAPTINPKDEMLMRALELGVKLAERINDARALITYNTQLQNLIARIGGNGETTQPLLPQTEVLSVSEVLEREGYPIHQKALKNSLGQVGKLVKANYLIDTGNEPETVEKLVGTNHKPTTIRLYPSDYFEKIHKIAVDYWDKKDILIK